ncbi:phage tail protein [Pantoea sp. B65]|uniref:phage tail protein n=1 Tax=Pantoea sp. B65 TaxID=2813359 RepID=UPI0039B54025
MTAKYFAILTNQGAARLANAAALGTKLNLTQMAVGDANGTLPTPDPAQTKLINQKRIAPLNLLTVDPANTSQIIAEQIIPENEGGFWIREIGLYDDAGVLIAVANCPETYKPQLQEGSGRTQTIRMILIVSSTSAITLKIDPSVVLATRQYVDDKVIEVKAYADELLKKHVDAENPHKQYLLIANALKEMADAGLIEQVFQNLGLGTAAKKNVGTGSNQIPDMSAWQKSTSGRIKWRKFPDGTIIQIGISTAGFLGVPVNITLPISFSDASYSVVASYDNARTGVNVIHGFAALPVSGSQFALMCSTPTQGTGQFAYWLAIGD